MGIEVGQTIGDYEVTGHVGAGGLGVVYEVRHVISRRVEAMKVLLPEQTGTAEMAERFLREVQLLATLNHANIAALHNAFYYNDQLVMVMELIHGETLRDKIRRIALPLTGALDYASQILSALEYAHKAGVIHRDIKPSNVMITDSNTVKLLDFGIAISDGSIGLTKPGLLLGSVNYMSPEQLNGGKATARSDIYSVAVTLYEVLTGNVPFAGATNYEIMLGHLQRTPVAPIEFNAIIPPNVSDAVMRALAKDPLERFATASEFNAALQARRSTAGDDVVRRTNTGRTRGPQADPTMSRTPSHPIASGFVQKPPSAGGMEALPLDTLTKQLAVFIGPVAKFVVKKLAAGCSDLDRLYAQAAEQIPSESDREKFLRYPR